MLLLQNCNIPSKYVFLVSDPFITFKWFSDLVGDKNGLANGEQ